MILEEVAGCWEVWWMRQNFIAQFVQLLKYWLCDMHCHGENWVLSVDQCWLQVAADSAVFSTSHQFTEYISQMSWFHQDSESCSGLDLQQTTKQTMTLFLVQVCFGASRSNHWASHRWLYKIHFSLHVTIWSRNGSVQLHRIRDNSKIRFFLFAVSSCGTHLPSFFTFPICCNAKWP